MMMVVVVCGKGLQVMVVVQLTRMTREAERVVRRVSVGARVNQSGHHGRADGHTAPGGLRECGR